MNDLIKIAHVRLAVAFLGEKAQGAWWKSSFLTPLGTRILSRLTPRTAQLACFHSASIAALRVHDAAIGKGGAIHLFRLPPEFEQEMQTVTHQWNESGLPFSCDSSREVETYLSSLSCGTERVSPSPGPNHIGDVEEWRNQSSIQKLCGIYLSAFRSGTPSFPYFA